MIIAQPIFCMTHAIHLCKIYVEHSCHSIQEPCDFRYLEQLYKSAVVHDALELFRGLHKLPGGFLVQLLRLGQVEVAGMLQVGSLVQTKGTVLLVCGLLEIRHAAALTTGAKHWHR